MNWRIKGIVQKALSVTPGGPAINDCLQRWAGGLRNFEANVDAKVRDDWFVFMSHLDELGISAAGRETLEVGTGWYPTLPVCFHLAGVKHCRTFDKNRHLDEGLCRRMLARIEHHLPEIARRAHLEVDCVRSRWQSLSSAPHVGEMLRRANVLYCAPADASRTSLPARSQDMVYSNSVFEHVPADVIQAILSESRRLLRPGGISMHSVNCGDHYAYFDRAITPIHYLRFTSRQWRFWNNDILYQNRLRPCDFLAMAETAGLRVVLSKWRPRPELLIALRGLKIAPQYRSYAPEQLCATSIDFVAVAGPD